MKFQFALATLVVLSMGFVQAADQKPLKYVLCKSNQKMVRTIRITPETSANSKCRVTYSKTGVDEVVGQSGSMTDCNSILKNIQDNLAQSQWNCKNVGNASIQFSNAVSVQ